jgi:Zn-finger nucleic acid-binding protein
MDCPYCSFPLISLIKQGLEFGYCLHKHGIWVASDELQSFTDLLMTEAMPKLLDESCEGESHYCALCEEKMEKLFLSHKFPVIAQCCPYGHGLWLEASELNKILQIFSQSLKSGEFFTFLNESLETALLDSALQN